MSFYFLNTNLTGLSTSLATEQITLESAASTWTFSYAYAYKIGNIVKLSFRAVATTNTTTIPIKDFVTLVGDFFQNSVMAYDITNGIVKYSNLQKNGNALNLVFSENQASGTNIVVNEIIILK